MALETFKYKTNQVVMIPFDSIVPRNLGAEKIKLLLFLRTGCENSATFRTKVEVINGEDNFIHWTYGARYPQNSISYNSETIEVPCRQTRDLKVSSNHIQNKNCHNMQFFVTAVFIRQ